jgi:hypothetical protein
MSGEIQVILVSKGFPVKTTVVHGQLLYEGEGLN